uniref:Uncharacterized protein n=1 Tax=viral metagenome TaxID=1070528 RepID=A0A6C0HB71_9ZZZZ
MEIQTTLPNILLDSANSIRSTTFTRYLHLVLEKCEEESFKKELSNFCEKYCATNSDDIWMLLSGIKQNDKHHKRFIVNDSTILGNAFFFIICYMKKNDSLFKYMNKNLLLMKLACNVSGHFDNGQDIDIQVENIMNSFDRVGALIDLNKYIEKITKNMDDETNYKMEAEIRDYGGYDYLNCKITM